MTSLMVKVESKELLLMEISFINGYISALGKVIPDCLALNDVLNQLKGGK